MAPTVPHIMALFPRERFLFASLEILVFPFQIPLVLTELGRQIPSVSGGGGVGKRGKGDPEHAHITTLTWLLQPHEFMTELEQRVHAVGWVVRRPHLRSPHITVRPQTFLNCYSIDC